MSLLLIRTSYWISWTCLMQLSKTRNTDDGKLGIYLIQRGRKPTGPVRLLSLSNINVERSFCWSRDYILEADWRSKDILDYIRWPHTAVRALRRVVKIMESKEHDYCPPRCAASPVSFCAGRKRWSGGCMHALRIRTTLDLKGHLLSHIKPAGGAQTYSCRL